MFADTRRKIGETGRIRATVCSRYSNLEAKGFQQKAFTGYMNQRLASMQFLSNDFRLARVLDSWEEESSLNIKRRSAADNSTLISHDFNSAARIVRLEALV